MLKWRRKGWVYKRTYGSRGMLLSLKPSFSLCWRSMFCGPEKAAGWSTSRSSLPCTARMLSKYRVCLKAGATVRLCLSLCFSARRANTNPVDTLVRYSHYVAVFQTEVPSAFTKAFLPLSPLLFPSLHLSNFLSLSLSLSAVHSSLFLCLVVRWPSTHVQLELNLWPWRDLSPLLPNHAHRWRCVFLIFSVCLCCCLCLNCKEKCAVLFGLSVVLLSFLQKV